MPRVRTNEHGLTDREMMFAEHYLATFDAPASYKLAGYRTKDAENTRTAASRLLNKPALQKLLQAKTAKILEKIEVSQEQIVTRLAAMAFADRRTLVDPACGAIKSLHEMTEIEAAQIDGFKIKEIIGTVVGEDGKKERAVVAIQREYKMASKVRPLELLGTNLGMFVQRVKHEGAVGVVDAQQMTPEQRAKIAREMLKHDGAD